MATVLITGIRKVDFEDDRGRQVKGTSLYYKQPLEIKNGVYAAGYMTAKLWIPDGSPLEQKIMSVSYEEPLEADLRYDIVPGGQRPQLVDVVF